MPPTPHPHPIDVQVGARIRMYRVRIGASQKDLATALGVSFQQVQKYERGANRISASMLATAARFLQAPIAAFFQGPSDPENGADAADAGRFDRVVAFLSTREGAEFADRILRLPPAPRRELLAFLNALAPAAADARPGDGEVGEVERSCDDPHRF